MTRIHEPVVGLRTRGGPQRRRCGLLRVGLRCRGRDRRHHQSLLIGFLGAEAHPCCVLLRPLRGVFSDGLLDQLLRLRVLHLEGFSLRGDRLSGRGGRIRLRRCCLLRSDPREHHRLRGAPLRLGRCLLGRGCGGCILDADLAPHGLGHGCELGLGQELRPEPVELLHELGHGLLTASRHLLQGLEDDLFELADPGHASLEQMQGQGLLKDLPLEHGLDVVRDEGALAHHHLVHQDTQGVDIRAGIRAFAGAKLRGHVFGGAVEGQVLLRSGVDGQEALISVAGDPGHLAAVGQDGDEDGVPGEVQMLKAGLVSDAAGRGDLPGQVHHLLYGNPALDQGLEGNRVGERHDQEDLTVVREPRSCGGYEQRRLQLADCPRGCKERRDRVPACGHLLVEHEDHNGGAFLCVRCLIRGPELVGVELRVDTEPSLEILSDHDT